ncbi:MAG: hypothetical protein ISS36_02755 [Candidatus Aenigmarchaeota archaeon]|nr:hypothetical protein [Candidatus Aenigmarchaeota archaeon]
MDFIDFLIKSETPKEAENMLDFSQKLGFSGLCIETDLKNIENLREKFPNVKILSIAEAKKIEDATKLKESHDLVFARSVDMDFNRKVSETPEIDMLLDPFDTSMCQFDQVMARLCKMNKISVGFSFSNLIFNDKLTRSNLMKSMLELSRILIKYKTPFRLVSGAVEKNGMRSSSELISFGRILGFKDPDIKSSLIT